MATGAEIRGPDGTAGGRRDRAMDHKINVGSALVREHSPSEADFLIWNA